MINPVANRCPHAENAKILAVRDRAGASVWPLRNECFPDYTRNPRVVGCPMPGEDEILLA